MGDGSQQGLLIADTVVVNFGLALMIGSLAGGAWVRHAVSPWAAGIRLRSRAWFRVATALTAVATGLGLWLQAAVMADAPLMDAWPTIVTMGAATHLGHAWAAGVLALGVAGGAGWSIDSWPARSISFAFAAFGIGAFAYSRSVVSHAGAHGDFSPAVWVDFAHLVLGCTWAGITVLAGYMVLSKPTSNGIDSHDEAAWVSALSTTATWTLVGIMLTGLFNIWRGAGPLDRLPGSAYGATLFVKLALVLFAATLGALNRFRVMPRLLTDLATPVGTRSDHKRVFVWILRVEAVALTGALVAAAFLSASEPPDGAAISFQTESFQEKP